MYIYFYSVTNQFFKLNLFKYENLNSYCSFIFDFIFFNSSKNIDSSANPLKKKLYSSSKKTKTYLNKGLLHGDILVYDKAGNLIERHGYFKGNRHGDWIFWNEEGQVTAVLRYHKGVKHGKWELYHSNGSLKSLMHYYEGSKTGIWKNFDTQEELLAEKNYDLPETSTVFSINKQ